jgi:hypothetical protein
VTRTLFRLLLNVTAGISPDGSPVLQG